MGCVARAPKNRDKWLGFSWHQEHRVYHCHLGETGHESRHVLCRQALALTLTAQRTERHVSQDAAETLTYGGRCRRC